MRSCAAAPRSSIRADRRPATPRNDCRRAGPGRGSDGPAGMVESARSLVRLIGMTDMESSHDREPGESEPTPTGIVVGRDLMFTAKVTGTAGELGYRMRVAGDVGTVRALIQELR